MGWECSITACRVWAPSLQTKFWLLESLGLGLEGGQFHLLLQGGPGGWLNISSPGLMLGVG